MQLACIDVDYWLLQLSLQPEDIGERFHQDFKALNGQAGDQQRIHFSKIVYFAEVGFLSEEADKLPKHEAEFP